MTQAAIHNDPASQPAAVLKRRLVGLGVLLAGLFLLSLLLRNSHPAPDALPVVVIPLNGSGAAVEPIGSAELAPVLDAPATASERMQQQAEAIERNVGEATAAATISPAPSRQTAEVASPPKPAPKAKPATEKPAAVAKAAPSKPTPSAAAAAGTRRWFVVVGAYKDPMAAQAIANRVKLTGFKGEAIPITSAGERLHRVRAGPFGSRDDAEAARATLIVEGLTKAILVGEK